jgi:hypothetical protein
VNHRGLGVANCIGRLGQLAAEQDSRDEEVGCAEDCVSTEILHMEFAMQPAKSKCSAGHHRLEAAQDHRPLSSQLFAANQTNLQADHLALWMKMTLAVMKPILSHDAAHGALPTLYAAVAAEAVAAGYYGPDGFMEAKGYPKAASIPKRALDETAAKRLWLESERLTRVKFGALSDVP